MDVSVEMSPITCCECGFTFAVPARWKRERLRDHAWFRCPAYSQIQRFTGESPEERYRRLWEQTSRSLQRERQLTEHLDHRVNGYKGYVAKLKKQRTGGRK